MIGKVRTLTKDVKHLGNLVLRVRLSENYDYGKRSFVSNLLSY